MRVFVAGARGVVGRRLVPLLVEAGHTVTGLSRTPEGVRELEHLEVRGVTGDVDDRQRMVDVMRTERPEVVFFQIGVAAATVTPRGTREQPASGVDAAGVRNVVEAARAAGTRRVVAQSYAHVYAPIGGWVKEESERLDLGPHAPEDRRRTAEAVVALEDAVCGTPGVEGVALRYGLLYGPCTVFDWDGALAELVRARRYPVAGGGTGWSSFVHVDDAAQAAMLALEGPAGRFNIGDDEPAPVSAWLPVYAREVCAPEPRRLPAFAARVLFGERFTFRSTAQRAADNRWARAQLGFDPRFRTWRHGFRAEFELELERAA
jgi:nucleoside-diphosphate-sugar epimerase